MENNKGFLPRRKFGVAEFWKEQRVASTLVREMSGASWMILLMAEANRHTYFEGRGIYTCLFQPFKHQLNQKK